MHLDRTKFIKEEKKLKKHPKEKENLELILTLIKQHNTFKELLNNPLSNIYGLERLRYNMSNYYSFNLNKKGGTIRLIFTINEITNTVILEYISLKHYEDFKASLKNRK